MPSLKGRIPGTRAHRLRKAHAHNNKQQLRRLAAGKGKVSVKGAGKVIAGILSGPAGCGGNGNNGGNGGNNNIDRDATTDASGLDAGDGSVGDADAEVAHAGQAGKGLLACILDGDAMPCLAARARGALGAFGALVRELAAVPFPGACAAAS